MEQILSGFGLILLAALCGGTFALPLKFIRRFQWENTWLWGAFFVMIMIPWLVASLFLPSAASIISAASPKAIGMALVFGFGWGFGTVTFGLGVSMIGLSLGYAIIMGVNTAVGSLLPMLVLSPADAMTPGGLVILLGIAGCLLGVVVCGYAGILKERGMRLRVNAAAVGDASKSGYGRLPMRGAIVKGMIICAVSGVLSAFMNLGFAFAQDISLKAQQHGASPSIAGIATWIVVFSGSFPAVLLYCGRLQLKNGSWRNNFSPGSGRDLFLAFTLGLLWFGAILLYGIGAHKLGRLGTSVGWAVNLSASLLVANVLGFVTAEWRSAPRTAVNWVLAGLTVLVSAMAILGYGNSLLARS